MAGTKLFLALLLSLSFSRTPIRIIINDQMQFVYLCEGPYSKVYHKSDHCKGLSRCSTRIDKVTLEEAKRHGRRPCHIEY